MTATLNLDSFRAMVGKDNYGEVRLNQNGQLEKINNHYLQREWNVGRQKPTASESQYIRESFMKAVSEAKIDTLTLANIRTKLGIGNGVIETNEAALDRHTIAEVLEMVDKNKASQLSKSTGNRNETLFKSFNTEFANIFGYKDSFGVTQHQRPNSKQGINLSSMKKMIKHWNGQHTKAEDKINLSDDQLKVLFNRHGLDLRNTIVGKLIEAEASRTKIQNFKEAWKSVGNKDAQNLIETNRKDRWYMGDMICKEIHNILANDNLESGATGLGVQGETRTESDNKKFTQMAEEKRKESGFKAANGTLFMSPCGVTRFCNNYKQVENAIKKNPMKLSDTTLFEPGDFRLEPYHGSKNEKTKDIFAKTVTEVGRLPMKVVVLNPRGDELETTQFTQTVQPKSEDKTDLDKANKSNAAIKKSNSDALTALMNTIKENKLFSDDENQKNKLLKAMGQKFLASVTNDIGWIDRDEDRKLVLKFNHDQTISATLYFKTQDTEKSMEFDFNIDTHGNVERKYLGPQDQVEAAKAAAPRKTGIS